MMWRRTLLSVTLVGGCVWCLAAVQQVHSEEKAAQPRPAGKPGTFKPVAPVHDLMEAQEQHFKEIVNRIRARKADSEKPNAKKAKDDFKRIGQHAYVVAELANVNQYNEKEADYKKWASEVRDLCIQVALAAKAKDVAKADGLVRKIHDKCDQCHDKYE